MYCRFAVEEFKKIWDSLATRRYKAVLDFLVTHWEKNKKFLKDVVNC